MKLLCHPNNIKEAMRRLRNNSGRNTKGVDNYKFRDLNKLPFNTLRNIIYKRIKVKPQVEGRKVQIPKKEKGKYRTLGITNIIDRVIQQMILNILEPCIEPFMSINSFGFRKGKSVHHAIATASNCYETGWTRTYQIDIEKCFDNIPLEIALSRLESDFNIKDQNFLNTIRWAMTVDYNGEKYNGIGLAQGNILSPILTNITLDRIDKEIDKLYYELPINTKKNFSRDLKTKPKMKDTRVKIVRYADDITIFATSEIGIKLAKDIINRELEEIGLKINQNKSFEFDGKDEVLELLGYNLRYSNKSTTKNAVVRQVNVEKYIKPLRNLLKDGMRNNNELSLKKFWSRLHGYMNFMRASSNINPYMEKLYELLYREVKTTVIDGKVYFAFGKGEEKIYINFYDDVWGKIKTPIKTLLMENQNWKPVITEINKSEWFSIELGKFRRTTLQSISWISLYRQQKGKDPIIKDKSLMQMGETEIHHRKPISKGGSDEYKNLVLLSKESHKLIHCKQENLLEEIINIREKYECKISSKNLEKFRKLAQD